MVTGRTLAFGLAVLVLASACSGDETSSTPSPSPAPLVRFEFGIPRYGVAVETTDGLTLVDLEGNVLAEPESLDLGEPYPPGPQIVRTADGSRLLLIGGRDTMSATGPRLPLSAKKTLVGDPPDQIAFGPDTLLEIADVEHVFVSSQRDLVTLVRVEQSNGFERLSARVYDTRTEEETNLPAPCRAADRRAEDRWVLICDRPAEEPDADLPSLERWTGPEQGTLPIVGAPPMDEVALGAWGSAAYGPEEDDLLAQWSGECDQAYLVSEDGTLRALPTDAPPEVPPETVALGWSPVDGRAVVRFTGTVCGQGKVDAGIYLVDDAGLAELLHPTPPNTTGALMWGPAPG